MRYGTALLIPVAFVIAGFAILICLSALANSWSRSSQEALFSVASWWAQYWWVLTILLGSVCLIIATVSDVLGYPKPRRKSSR